MSEFQAGDIVKAIDRTNAQWIYLVTVTGVNNYSGAWVSAIVLRNYPHNGVYGFYQPGDRIERLEVKDIGPCDLPLYPDEIKVVETWYETKLLAAETIATYYRNKLKEISSKPESIDKDRILTIGEL